ncbi:MAG: GAF domain-containing sensor histidine kinase [Candidatus Eremiobacteraeota bacterium]|nr:GAF domain-containing sensor histidine kinase [Candidatus Eremiobacteraeota bacterium]
MTNADDLALLEAIATTLGSSGRPSDAGVRAGRRENERRPDAPFDVDERRDAAAVDAELASAAIDEGLDRVLEIVGRRLNLETGWIWLLDPETGRFYLAAALNLPPLLRRPVEMTAEPCWCMESFTSGALESKNVDIVACSRLRSVGNAPQLTGGMRYHASVALRFAQRRLGIMNLTGQAWRPLSKRRLQLLGTVGAIVGLAIERGNLADAATLAARSDERAMLARDIHDTLAQDLTAVGLQLERAARHLTADPAAARKALDTALAVTRQSLRDTRDSIVALRADPLHGKPLAAALASLAHRFTSESGIRATVEAKSTAALPHAIEVELHHIANEALANVSRHADAQRVRVQLTSDDRAVGLRIFDDGSGFDTNQPHADRYGLLGMNERAERLGGSFTISSTARGTAIDVTIPLTASANSPAKRLRTQRDPLPGRRVGAER